MGRMIEMCVRPMTQPEYDVWRLALAEAYAQEQVAAGRWAPDEALALSFSSTDDLLPDGPSTEGMLLLKGIRPDGVPVGVLWISLTHPRGAPDCAFLYDIEVVEEHRGAGYGRALLAAAEDAVRARGISALELNVFGGNERAIRLYASSGYEVATQQMRKNLD